ncbi:hypothetical protein Bca52824_020551 [Brassica carinata]|uniref:Gnk2-homologous domain-containing protein n=1 Tax=Brassica carinata TaxID=52824 RepID=A0A8X7VTB4_BRACI|nr:hypothetical protein Bca52824_020551 [Brassica carinata]
MAMMAMCVSKRLLLLPILAMMAIQFLFVRTVSSVNMTNSYLHHKCFVDQGKYEPESEYEENLNRIIDPIPVTSESFERGTKMEMIGEGSDLISFTLQCRGDTSGPRCRSCYATALSALRRRCPSYKGRMIWYDQCILEISTIDSLDKIDYSNNLCMSNAKKIMAHYYSNSDWLDLIHNLTTKAIRQGNSKGMYYAAGETRLGIDNIYAMVQCSFYLSSRDCEKCLRHNIKHYEDCLFNRQGARVLGKSCSFRYEFYPFLLEKSSHKYLKI